MRRYLLVSTGLGVALLLSALPLLAHHSFAAQFDSKKPIKFTGTVTKVEFLNPHIYIYIDAKDSSGKNVNYAVEGAGVTGLLRQGWRKDTVKVGDTLSVEGSRARDGSNTVAASAWLLPDGRKIFGGNNTAAQGNPYP
jgi:hypothetical protein